MGVITRPLPISESRSWHFSCIMLLLLLLFRKKSRRTGEVRGKRGGVHGDGARARETGVGEKAARGKAFAGSSRRMGVYKAAGTEAWGGGRRRWDKRSRGRWGKRCEAGVKETGTVGAKVLYDKSKSNTLIIERCK